MVLVASSPANSSSTSCQAESTSARGSPRWPGGPRCGNTVGEATEAARDGRAQRWGLLLELIARATMPGVNLFRANRLFHPGSGRCLAVAVDHGMPGEPDLLEGIEDMEAVVDALVAANPDAILLAPGQAQLLQRGTGRGKPALVLRVDTGNVFGREVPDRPASWMYEDPVGLAVRLDAACVVANLQDSPGQPSLRESCVENLMRLRPACDRAGMPMMVEPVPMAPNRAGYDVHRDAERLRGLVRQATELGADLIKCDPLPDRDAFARVVRTARVPVLVRGGGRIGEAELMAVTADVLAAGAAGLVYGRNVIQHPDPAAMVRALAALVHEDATADAASALLR
jgi:fructose-bisphosphate aldolase, class I